MSLKPTQTKKLADRVPWTVPSPGLKYSRAKVYCFATDCPFDSLGQTVVTTPATSG